MRIEAGQKAVGVMSDLPKEDAQKVNDEDEMNLASSVDSSGLLVVFELKCYR